MPCKESQRRSETPQSTFHQLKQINLRLNFTLIEGHQYHTMARHPRNGQSGDVQKQRRELVNKEIALQDTSNWDREVLGCRAPGQTDGGCDYMRCGGGCPAL